MDQVVHEADERWRELWREQQRTQHTYRLNWPVVGWLLLGAAFWACVGWYGWHVFKTGLYASW